MTYKKPIHISIILIGILISYNSWTSNFDDLDTNDSEYEKMSSLKIAVIQEKLLPEPMGIGCFGRQHGTHWGT